ncbi:MAG: hypothetical protein SPI25_02280 [Dialister sp.]|nr:hypothetical protein [Dialister sp.]
MKEVKNAEPVKKVDVTSTIATTILFPVTTLEMTCIIKTGTSQCPRLSKNKG